MKAREQIKRRDTINNYSTLAWFVAFALSLVALAFLDSLIWAWVPAIACSLGWLISMKFLIARCPFCDHIPSSIERGVIENYCESCGESFDRQVIKKP